MKSKLFPQLSCSLLRQFSFFVVLLSLLGSCSTSQDAFSSSVVQKRKYRKGFHIDIGQGKRKAELAHMSHRSDKSSFEGSEEVVEDPFQSEPSGEASIAEDVLIAANEAPADIIVQSEHRRRMRQVAAVKESKKIKRRRALRFVKNQFVKAPSDTQVTTTHWGSIAGFSSAVLGLFVAGIILGLCAIIFSAIAMSAHAKDPSAYNSKGLAVAGLVLGIIVLLLTLIVVASLA